MANTYYRIEIEGYGTFFRDIDEVLNIFRDSDGITQPEFSDMGLDEYLEDIENSLYEITSILPVPQLDFGTYRFKSVFTEYGYSTFEESILDIQYSLRALGFNLEILELNIDEDNIIYRDEYQALYLV